MNLHSSLTAAVLPFVLLSSVYAQPAQIQVNASQVSNSVSPYLGTGACLEDVNHEVYGGLYSQMIFGESFQEPSYGLNPRYAHTTTRPHKALRSRTRRRPRPRIQPPGVME